MDAPAWSLVALLVNAALVALLVPSEIIQVLYEFEVALTAR